jgi:hypothetical protein
VAGSGFGQLVGDKEPAKKVEEGIGSKTPTAN